MKRFVWLCLAAVLVLSACTAAAEEWTCPQCGRTNTGNFCPDCGSSNPKWECPFCGRENYSAFCENCGSEHPTEVQGLFGIWKVSSGGETSYIFFGADGKLELGGPDGLRAEGTYAATKARIALISEELTIPLMYTLSDDSLQLESPEYETVTAVRIPDREPGDCFCEGIYIDDIAVGGMTREQALQILEDSARKEISEYKLTVSIGNDAWYINQERVPLSRNITEVVEQAWMTGREDWLERVMLIENPAVFHTQLEYDRDTLREFAEGIANYIYREPVDSVLESFNFKTAEFTFTAAKPGRQIDADGLYEQLAGLLDIGVTQGNVTVVPEEITAGEKAEQYGMISSSAAVAGRESNRIYNARLSAQAINGKVVMPGETFSFNSATGELTAEKGYTEAIDYDDGPKVTGGGVSVTSTALFAAAVGADLEIIERNAFPWPCYQIKKGLEAMVSYPGLDLQFRNNTEDPVFIVAEGTGPYITVSLYGRLPGKDTRIGLKSKVIKTIPKPTDVLYEVNTDLAPGTKQRITGAREGYTVETWKVWYQADEEVKRELLYTTKYKAYQETWEHNPE